MTSPWRARLRPASFRGAQFHIDTSSKASGRRIALLEFPARDVPYAEDLGRRAKRFAITGYIVGPDYTSERDALLEALEREGPGQLVHPTMGALRVAVETYTTSERREAGGMCILDMTFSEAGSPMSERTTDSTAADVKSQVDAARTATAAGVNSRGKPTPAEMNGH